MGRWGAAVLVAWSSVALGQAIRVRAPSFKTESTTFVEVPGTRLVAAPSLTGFALLLWRATVTSEASGPSTSEVIIEPLDGGARWGFFAGGHVPRLSGQLFRNMDWTAGLPVDLVARVRSTVPDAGVTVANFEVLFLPIGSVAQVPFFERTDTIVVDGGWSPLMQVATTRSGDWLLLAQANTQTSNGAGVTLRVRNVLGTIEAPPPLDATPSGGALFSLGGARPFFVAQLVSVGQTADVFTFEARSLPGSTVASIRDARLVMVELLPLEEEDFSMSTSLSPTTGSPLVLATASPGPDRYLLSMVSGLAAADAGLTASWRAGARGSFADWPSLFEREQPVVSDWFFERTGTGGQTASIILRTPAQTFGAAAPFTLSMWRWDGGVIERGSFDAPDAGVADAGAPDAGVPDAGVPDAGPPDAGVPDAGVPDAGVPDAGVPDAGPPDAGVPDAGAPDASLAVVDASVPDASSEFDGGPMASDGGLGDAGAAPDAGAQRVELAVGCGCQSFEGVPLLVLLVLLGRRTLRL